MVATDAMISSVVSPAIVSLSPLARLLKKVIMCLMTCVLDISALGDLCVVLMEINIGQRTQTAFLFNGPMKKENPTVDLVG